MSETPLQTADVSPADPRADHLFLQNECPADYAALLIELRAAFPFVTDGNLITDAAHARWMLWRRQRAYHRIESALYEAQPGIVDWTDATHHKLGLADRYKTSAERSFRRAFINLESHRQNHLRAEQRQEEIRRWDIKDFRDERRLGLREKRLTLDVERTAFQVLKEKPQADLAAAKVLDEINRLDDHRRANACGAYNRPTIVQKIQVRTHDGITHTNCSPDNQEVFRRIAQSRVYPAEQIVRQFEFIGGVPSEYRWAIDAGIEFSQQNTTATLSEVVPLSRFRVYDQIQRELQTNFVVGHAGRSSATGTQDLLGKMRRFFAPEQKIEPAAAAAGSHS